MADKALPYQFVETRLGGICWLVREDYRESTLEAWGSGWKGSEIVRTVPGRKVRRLESQRPILIKHFRHQDFLGLLKALLRGTPAAREWKTLQQAQRRDIATPAPLALGERVGLLKSESFLVSEAFRNAISLDRYLAGPEGKNVFKRWTVIRKVASLIRKAHDGGLQQPDLHLGNIMIRETENGLEAFLIDLQRATLAGTLTTQKRVANLAVLHGGCADMSRTDRLRFLKHYLSYPPPLPFDLRQLTAELEQKGRRHRFNLWRSRQKRCLRENRDFARRRRGAFFGFARRDCLSEDFARLLEKPDRLVALPGTHVVKDSRTTTVAVNRDLRRRFYIKRYNYQGLGYAIKDLFRSSRARRTWLAANSLHMRGIFVALPLAYLERRRFGFLLESYILTAAVDGEPLRDILRRYRDFGYPLSEKRTLLGALARVVKRLHESGVACRDLKASNLVVDKSESGSFRFHIVDFDGVYFGRVGWRRRMKNLARLAEEAARYRCFTRADRLRFLVNYLGSPARDWKRAWKQVASRL